MSHKENYINQLESLLQDSGDDSRIKHVFWVGAGGSYAGFFPAHYLMQHEATRINSELYTSREFELHPPKSLGETSLVIVCSMRGTPETISAAKVAIGKSAKVVSLYVEESELTTNSHVKIKYESLAEEDSRIELVNSTIALHIAFFLLKKFERYSLYEEAVLALSKVDDLYRTAYKKYNRTAKVWAARNKNEDVIHIIGGGPLSGAAYIFSICNLMEMQWIHAPFINSSEFFHGPFECISKSLPVVLLLSVGTTRDADERVSKFLDTYGSTNILRIDSKDLGISAFHESISEYFNHIIMVSLLNNVFLKTLATVRDHDYNSRRYMWKVEY